MDCPSLSTTSSNKQRYSSMLSRRFSSNYDQFEKDQLIFQEGMQETGSTRRMSFKQSSIANYENEWKQASLGSCQNGPNANSIMSSLSKKTYGGEHLNTEQLTYFCNFIFLSKGIKHFCYTDAQVFQTFHYMLYNRQKIPSGTIENIMAMANVNNLSSQEISAFSLCWSHRQTIGIKSSKNRKKLFLPPLGLALDLIKNNQAPLHTINLKKMFEGCFDIKFVPLFKQLNLKIVAYNQIAEMLELFDLFSEKEGAYNLGQLNKYLQNCRLVLEVNNSEQVLDRFFPETRIRYIKASSQQKGLDQKNTKYLFNLLQSVKKLRGKDFEILFCESSYILTYLEAQEVENKNQSFEKILEDITGLFSQKKIINASQFFNNLEKALNFESCIIQDTIISSYILSVLSELSYRKFIFPLSLTKKLNNVMTTIPHERIKKLICFILLCQKRNIGKQQKVPESQFDALVDWQEMDNLFLEARGMALKLLIEDKKNLDLHKQQQQILFDLVEKSSNVEMITQVSKLYIKIKKANERPGYDELLTKLDSSKFEKVSFPMLKVIINQNEMLSEVGIQRLLDIIEMHKKKEVQIGGLQILLSIFQNESMEIKSSVIKRVFDTFMDSKDFDVRVRAFQIVIESTEKKEFFEVIDIILEQCITFLVRSCHLFEELKNERESSQKDKNETTLKSMQTKKIEMCEKICFIVYKIFENLGRHNMQEISKKKQTLENQLLSIYRIVKKQKCLVSVQNDIINSFNYALINELSIPDEIFLGISDEMLNKKEYHNYFKKTPIFNISQEIQKEKKNTKNQKTPF